MRYLLHPLIQLALVVAALAVVFVAGWSLGQGRQAAFSPTTSAALEEKVLIVRIRGARTMDELLLEDVNRQYLSQGWSLTHLWLLSKSDTPFRLAHLVRRR